ncbi:hypothetical protein [Flavobacterium caseinilyticum]|uniref:Uncharacterized protein n=2 Tax=Flavobacteriaceae TaxID=49546 RepID=A0A4V2YTH8_9FLAO|nr:hypothetical protein [Flavobacterium caseinilyticum]TDD73867.1 hypothetical protein E0F89_16615 [Flavobacterium caseinilyticum]
MCRLKIIVLPKVKGGTKMKQKFIKQTDVEEYILKNYEDIERENEQKFVNLMIEIIVSLTLKELYEEGD